MTWLDTVGKRCAHNWLSCLLVWASTPGMGGYLEKIGTYALNIRLVLKESTARDRQLTTLLEARQRVLFEGCMSSSLFVCHSRNGWAVTYMHWTIGKIESPLKMEEMGVLFVLSMMREEMKAEAKCSLEWISKSFAFLVRYYELICHHKEKWGILISIDNTLLPILLCGVDAYNVTPSANYCFYSFFLSER